MTKILVTLLAVLIIVPVAYGQGAADTLFTITYDPSFHNPSKLTVYKDAKGSKGLFQTISIIDGKVKMDTATASLPSETYTAYVRFFSTYSFPGYKDNKLQDTTKGYGLGFDGITIMGAYFGDTKRLFRFWSPYHDKESRTLFNITLRDLDQYFKTRENRKYLKWLKRYAK